MDGGLWRLFKNNFFKGASRLVQALLPPNMQRRNDAPSPRGGEIYFIISLHLKEENEGVITHPLSSVRYAHLATCLAPWRKLWLQQQLLQPSWPVLLNQTLPLCLGLRIPRIRCSGKNRWIASAPAQGVFLFIPPGQLWKPAVPPHSSRGQGKEQGRY